MSADEFLAEEGARVANWLGGLLTRGLALPEGLTVDQRSHQMEAARAAAAELAGAHWGHGDAGIEARVQAAQFVSAHAAAMDWQAQANRRDLPPHARATAQRLARQLMALTTSQLNGLSRLKAERRKDREEAARAVARQTAAEAKARSADRRALVAEMERTLKTAIGPQAAANLDRPGSAGGFAEASEIDPDFDAELDSEAMADLDLDKMADLAIAMAAPPPGTEALPTAPPDPPPVGPPAPAKPEAVGAGVPAPPPEPAPPLNRQQCRALERLRRKERLRADRGAGGAA